MVADSVNISGQSNNVQFKVESGGGGDVSELYQDRKIYQEKTNIGFQGTLVPTHAFQMSRNVSYMCCPRFLRLTFMFLNILLRQRFSYSLFSQVPDCRLSDDLGSLFENSQVSDTVPILR